MHVQLPLWHRKSAWLLVKTVRKNRQTSLSHILFFQTAPISYQGRQLFVTVFHSIIILSWYKTSFYCAYQVLIFTYLNSTKALEYFSAGMTLNFYIMSYSIIMKHFFYDFFSAMSNPLGFPRISESALTDSSGTKVYIHAAFGFPSSWLAFLCVDTYISRQ